MASFVRGWVASCAVVLLASCGSSSLESSSNAQGAGACYPATFACEGYTPGFWSNKNGCDRLVADPALLSNLNAFLTSLGIANVTTANDCAAMDELLKVEATDMKVKLVAMFSAFALDYWSFWGEACTAGSVEFSFDASRWASSECRTAVAGLFGTGAVTFDDVSAAVSSAYSTGTRCEQEALVSFLDAANNSANVCTCSCPTGGVSGATGAALIH